MAEARVRMKALTVFNNPLITVHAAEGEFRPDPHTVIEDDEFSTGEGHAAELERAGFAEPTKGKAAPLSDEAARLLGSQTSGGGALTTQRQAADASAAREAAEKAAAEKAAAEKAAAEKAAAEEAEAKRAAEASNKMAADASNKSA